ncbi:hypothetical protein K435DRAFT_793912 [Dendrothele bispora CBS 962.96]|uniref:Uncharacterized protein n=1 Tax=Dendrothele bispora (strain CBS 962.96) TaxID=1314807 RepID=A0A4S8MDU6_DENBC|nr:hypothetical protein K435DRAFT_793912 [Dendrothele bispora CBS 962.96]
MELMNREQLRGGLNGVTNFGFTYPISVTDASLDIAFICVRFDEKSTLPSTVIPVGRHKWFLIHWPLPAGKDITFSCPGSKRKGKRIKEGPALGPVPLILVVNENLEATVALKKTLEKKTRPKCNTPRQLQEPKAKARLASLAVVEPTTSGDDSES